MKTVMYVVLWKNGGYWHMGDDYYYTKREADVRCKQENESSCFEHRVARVVL